MPRTARDLIKDAGVTAGIVSPKQNFNGNEVADALVQLNNILEQMNLDDYFPPQKFLKKATINNNEIVIGSDPSADIDMRRPNIITSVAYILGNVEYPLLDVTQDDYDDSMKTDESSGYPVYYVVRTDYPLMKIELYPKMTANLDVVVSGRVALGDWTLDTEVLLPDGYAPFLEYKLAEILALRYGNVSYELIRSQAQDYLNRIKRINNKGRMISKRGTIQTRGRYDIYSDDHYKGN